MDNNNNIPLKAILCCVNYNNSLVEIREFIKCTPTFFDGIFFLNYSLCDSCAIEAVDERISCIQPSTEFNDAVRIEQFVKAFTLGAKWICFVDTNERIDNRLCSFNLLEHNAKDKSSVYFDVIHTSDNKHYNDSLVIKQEIRMFNLDVLSSYNFVVDKSNVYNSHILLLLNEHEKNKNTGVYLSIDELYECGDQLENVGHINDEKLLKDIDKKIHIIGDYILNDVNPCNDISLYSGDTGILLTLAMYYLHTKEDAYLNKAYQYIDNIQELIINANQSTHIRSSFCSGLAGYGWTICFLSKNNIIDVEEELLNQLDEILLFNMKYHCQSNSLDILHGALSIGRYFLIRNNKDALCYLITYLNENKIDTRNEIKWSSQSVVDNSERYDFGLAHGMAGYLYFIRESYLNDIMPDICIELIYGILRFYDHNIQDINKVNSYYPTIIDTDKYLGVNTSMNVRLAWCYGDIGILYTLYNTANSIGDKKYEELYLSQLEQISLRRNLIDTHVIDACFCHGSISIAQMFYRLFIQTQMQCFKDSYIYWLKVTLILGRNTTASPTGYVFYQGNENHWVPLDSLIEGVAGVGIGLLSIQNKNYLLWDKAMMLS